MAAELQCPQECRDWSDVGPLHVYGRHIVPDAEYVVEVIECGCDTGDPSNYSAPRPVPRAVNKMSPHSHSDFEQGSLCLSGTFVHHLRWPWGTDQRLWREDTHEICAGPSLAVIPSLVVHTSQECGTNIIQLVDLFAPPRAVFLAQPGWVLNADEYPESGR